MFIMMLKEFQVKLSIILKLLIYGKPIKYLLTEYFDRILVMNLHFGLTAHTISYNRVHIWSDLSVQVDSILH